MPLEALLGMEGPKHAPPPRQVIKTGEFKRWSATLDAERQAKVSGAIALVAARGSTLGRPYVDVIHGSRVHKLKEIRIDRGARVLFAFDSNRNAIMLVGGDKSGKWNRWYPSMVRRAERLYLNHERGMGKEAHSLHRSGAARTSPQRSL